MSIARLKLVSNAGEPDAALALRIDVVAAAEAYVAAVDAQIREKDGRKWMHHQAKVDNAGERLYRITKRYMRACKRRNA